MKLSSILESLAYKLSEQIIIKSIRRGLMYFMPLVLIGGFAVMILNLPIPVYHEYVLHHFAFFDLFRFIQKGTIQIISISILISISYALIMEKKTIPRHGINPIIPVLIVVGCYFTLLINTETIISDAMAASTGMFVSIICAVGITKLFLFFYEHRVFTVNLLTDDIDLVLSQTLSVLEPALMTFLSVSALRAFIVHFQLDVIYLDAYNNLVGILSNYASNLTLGVVYNIILQGLWFVGLHGSNILDQLNMDVFAKASGDNIYAIQHGLPPMDILTKQFFDVFVYLGGCGSTLCLVLASFAKGGRDSRRLANFSLLPSLFNINEILVYGLPIVFNPYYLIPFMLTPIALTITSYLAMYSGLVPLTITEINWTTPILLGGYLATNSIAGAILQLVNLLIGALIYIPFVELAEKHKVEINKRTLKALTETIYDSTTAHSINLVHRTDDIGFFARALTREISAILNNKKSGLTLQYQPQLNEEGRVVGAEALLRWNHRQYGWISPPVIVALADEANMATSLGEWIMKTAYRQLAEWNRQGLDNLRISVNISARQLNSGNLLQSISGTLAETKVQPSHMDFELTESAALDRSDKTREILAKVREIGAHVSIDDFGMGHSSLLYIRDYYVNAVKLDGTLVKDICTDSNSQEIVASIVSLCDMLKLLLIAEVVETREQRDKLLELGCNIYQGHYYSPSLPPEEFWNYVRRVGLVESKEI